MINGCLMYSLLVEVIHLGMVSCLYFIVTALDS